MPAPAPYETELKLTLPDEAAWRRLRAELTDRHIERQENVFFDRPDGALRARRLGVRLRRAGEDCRLTVKTDPEAGRAPQAALTRRIELETRIPVELFEAASHARLDLRPWIARWRAEAAGRAELDPRPAALLDTLDRLADVDLEPIGAFRNERTRGRLALDRPGGLPAWIEVELDRTDLPGDRRDYEIEVELRPGESDAAAERLRDALVERLSALGIRTGTAESKLARFLAILDAR
jgi:inorganic triphosphatase YgiF